MEKKIIKSHEGVTSKLREKGYKGDLLLKKIEVMAVLSVSRTKFHEILQKGELVPVKHGEKSTRFFESDVVNYLENMRNNITAVTYKDIDYTNEEIDFITDICGNCEFA